MSTHRTHTHTHTSSDGLRSPKIRGKGANSLEEVWEFCLECWLLDSVWILNGYRGSILLQGPPKVGKSMFCRNFMRRTERMKQPLVYVTVEEEPEQVLCDLVSQVGGVEESVRMVDCYTWRLGEKPKDGYLGACSADLSDLSITMQKATEGLDGPNVVVDGISPIALDCGEDATLKWLRTQVPRLRANRSLGLFTVAEGLHSSTFLNAIRTIFDCIIEMKVEEDSPDGLRRLIRIFASRAGSPVGGGWTSFKVTERGIVIGTKWWQIKAALEDGLLDMVKMINYYSERGILRKLRG